MVRIHHKLGNNFSKNGYICSMTKYSRRRNLVDPDTGESFFADERIKVIGRANWDNGRFVKLFMPGVEVLSRFKPSEMFLVTYVLSKLKRGSRELQLSFQGYNDWHEMCFAKPMDRSAYHKALNALVREGLLVKAGKDYLINHKMAFVGDRGKFLHLDNQIGKLT